MAHRQLNPVNAWKKLLKQLKGVRWASKSDILEVCADSSGGYTDSKEQDSF